MLRNTEISELRPEMIEVVRRAQHLVHSYLAGLAFIAKDTARDPAFTSNHLLSYLSQDILQSAMAVMTLTTEGVLNVVRRELRFLIEASIKICYVQQRSYSSTIEEKLQLYDKVFQSQRISIKNNLDLPLLSEGIREEFYEEVGRLYGATSKYVHLSPDQIVESIALAQAGITSGMEGPSEVEKLNLLAERVLAASLVLLFHSVPSWVAGDWLVDRNGSTIDWHFVQSKFIADLDQQFDYKHERQDRLAEIQAHRAVGIRF
ncbi:hypothetical protein [Sphingorhabdus sp.]|jgi:hypothetical protein|uniref:hypothetical protein n=1 Tax=Sphingorhabdus sp. TaxID=1902408 RepID=UPI002BEEE20D|nr:hypothetical protein [Sphingorhabdus sp.]HMT41599.1 hypothetical protein [Sphingorhabdus sp.]